MPVWYVEHLLAERFRPFIGVILTAIRTYPAVAAKRYEMALVTMSAMIYVKSTFRVLAGEHFVYFLNFNLAKCVFVKKTIYIPIVIVLEYVPDRIFAYRHMIY
jgi:hypothetical protein